MTPSRKSKKVRIAGVVRAMNAARQQLAAGIPPDEAKAFRKWVRQVIHEVDAICKENRIRPNQLPAPTYNAYKYLKGIDLKALPEPAPGAGAPKKTQLSFAVGTATVIEAMLSEYCVKPENEAWEQQFFENIQETVSQYDLDLAGQDATPFDLPVRSQRAYLWLKYLSEWQNFSAQLAALRLAYSLLHPPSGETAACHASARMPVPRMRLDFSFYYHGSLIKTRPERALWIVASQGFVNAPAEVLQAIICAALVKDKSAYVEQVRRYSASEDYTEAILALELLAAREEVRARGHVYDLDTVFDRVNRRYFEGVMPRPRLTWNETLTSHKLGHYHLGTDTLMVSISLDQPAIPQYVVEFVMYHELLHKQLGVTILNGRTYSHTPAFRQAERQFKEYKEAMNFFEGTSHPKRKL